MSFRLFFYKGAVFMQRYLCIIAMLFFVPVQGMKQFIKPIKFFSFQQLQKHSFKTKNKTTKMALDIEENSYVQICRKIVKIVNETRELQLPINKAIMVRFLLENYYKDESIIKQAYGEIISGRIKSGHL